MANKRTSVLNEERRRSIVDYVNQNGLALVRELARKYASSEITIRRDLEMLHNRGLVYRTHGGALPIRAGTESDRNLTEREMQHPREKQRIAAAAAKMVREGQSVVLDSGSTTTAIARAFSGTTIDVILTGGMLRANSYSLVGPIAEESLRRLKADILFLGVDGFDTQTGVSTPNLLEAQLNRLMVQIAARVIAVCDSSKFGRTSLSSIVPLSNIHGVITDKQIPAQHLRALKKAGIETAVV